MSLTALTLAVALGEPYLLLTLAVLVGPALAGYALGRGFRGWAQRRGLSDRRSSAIAAILAVTPFVLLPEIATAAIDAGTWDVVSLLLMFGAGLLVGGWPSRTPRRAASLVAAGVSGLLCLLALELLTRVALPPIAPPGGPSAQLVGEGHARDLPCGVLFPDGSTIHRASGRPPPDAPVRPVVLHLGDSMIDGILRPDDETALLRRLAPAYTHVAAGAPGASPEVYVEAARRWIPQVRPTRALVYIFAGNDLSDLGRSYLCCDAGPLFDPADRGPSSRCAQASWRAPLGLLLGTSPAPLPLRSAARGLESARWAILGLRQLNARLLDAGRPPAARPLDQLALLRHHLTTLRDETDRAGVPLTAIVLPFREAVEHALGLPVALPRAAARFQQEHRAIVETANGLGLETVDAWGLFTSLVRTHGADAFSADWPRDVHLSEAGSAAFAAFVATVLERGPAGVATEEDAERAEEAGAEAAGAARADRRGE